MELNFPVCTALILLFKFTTFFSLHLIQNHFSLKIECHHRYEAGVTPSIRVWTETREALQQPADPAALSPASESRAETIIDRDLGRETRRLLR